MRVYFHRVSSILGYREHRAKVDLYCVRAMILRQEESVVSFSMPEHSGLMPADDDPDYVDVPDATAYQWYQATATLLTTVRIIENKLHRAYRHWWRNFERTWRQLDMPLRAAYRRFGEQAGDLTRRLEAEWPEIVQRREEVQRLRGVARRRREEAQRQEREQQEAERRALREKQESKYSWYEQAEECRVRAVEQAQASGGWDAPVLWWMKIPPPFIQPRRLWSPTRDDPWNGLRSYEKITVRHQRPDGHHSEERYTVSWGAAERALAVRCTVQASGLPPAVEERVADLSDLYVIRVDGSLTVGCMQFGNQRNYPEPIHTRDVTTEMVVADRADFRRWHEAADTYLRELDAVRFDLAEYWVQHWRRIRAPGAQDGPLQAWQDQVTAGYARLVRVSDAYRPVFDEVTAAVWATVPAYEYQMALCQRLEDWTQRQLWCLIPTGPKAFLIARSDIADAVPPETAPDSLPDVFAQARKKRTAELCTVDWDPSSVRACDAELAALSTQYPPVGTTRSGQPMASPAPTRFATWFMSRFGASHDKLFDRDELARDRQRRAEMPGDVSRHTVSSSYHTDPGAPIDIGGYSGYGSPSF